MERLLKRLRDERIAIEKREKFVFELLDTTGLQFDALVQRSEGWMKARENKLTASNFGIICELSKFATARSFWELRTGKLGSVDTEETKHMRRGRLEEFNAVRLYENITSEKVEETGLYLAPAPLDFLGASPDGLLANGEGLVEIKCPSREHYVNIQDEHMAQIQGQLAICKRKYCDFCSFLPGVSMRIWRVNASEAYWWVNESRSTPNGH